MFSLFKSRTVEPVTLVAHLASCLTEPDRRLRYDEPLRKLLSEGGLGEVIRAGSVTDAEDRILFNDVELRLNNADAVTLDRVVALFDSQGTPKGSWLQDSAGKVLRRFGTTEVLVLELDGSAAKLGAAAIDALVDRIVTQIAHAGRFAGSRSFASSTELYFHARGTKSVEAVLAGMLISDPLCQNARAFRFAA